MQSPRPTVAWPMTSRRTACGPWWLSCCPWAVLAAEVVLDDGPGAHEGFDEGEARELLARFHVAVPRSRHLSEAHGYTGEYMVTPAGEVLRQQHERLHRRPVDHDHPLGEEPW